MSSHFTHRRTVAALLLAGYVPTATGCTSWQTQTGSAQAVLTAQPGLARTDTTIVYRANGERYVSVSSDASLSRQSIRIATTSQPMMTELTGPRVTNDSLYGSMDGGKDVTGVPLSEVTAVQVRKGSAGKTVALVGGVVVVGLVVSALAVEQAVGHALEEIMSSCWTGLCQ